MQHSPMARSTDSFFIRTTKDLGNTNTFHEKAIDLGAYVDALGKSVLRIHNIQVTYSDANGASSTIDANEVGVAQWQLTTQSFGSLQLSSNRSVVSDGRIHMFNDQGSPKLASNVSDVNGINLHEWTNGYLIAVEQLYFGGSATTTFVGDVYCSIVMECTVETMTQSAAMALALSQQ
tara:strand:- start:517 stop:1047 length:531 start_codon:yes stop_codon:yes gene_type:complete